jgi:hypothetical protein
MDSGVGGETNDRMVGKPQQFAARVKSVDAARNTLTLDNGAQIEIGPGAQFTRDGNAASLSDIKPGDEVRASFVPGSMVLRDFTVTSPQGTREPKQ